MSSEGQRPGRFHVDAPLLLGSQYLGTALGLLTSILAARSLGPAAFGIAAVVMAYPMLGRSLASVKTGPVTLRYSVEFFERREWTSFAAIVKLGLALDIAAATIGSLMAVLVVVALGGVPGAPGTIDLVVLFGLSLPVAALDGTTQGILLTMRRFGITAALLAAQKAVILAGVLIALSIESSASSLVIGTAVGQAASSAGGLLAASLVLTREGGYWWRGSWTKARESLAHLSGALRHLFGWNFANQTLLGVIEQGPVVILGGLASSTDAGYFRISSSVIVLARGVASAMERAAYPALASAYARDEAREFGRLIRGWARRESIIATLAVLTATALLPFLVPLLYGDSYDEMIPGLEVMVAGASLGVLFFYVTPIIYITGQIRRWAAAYGVYAALTIIAGTAAAGEFGFIGFAIPFGVGGALLFLSFGLRTLRSAKRLVDTDDPSLFERAPIGEQTDPEAELAVSP